MPRRCAVLDLDHRHTCPEQARPEAESAMKRKPAGHDRYELHPQLAADTHPVASFALSDLRLMDDSNYPWLVLVPRVAGASELVDLDPMQRRELGEIGRAHVELQSLMRISYAVFCLKKKNTK